MQCSTRGTLGHIRNHCSNSQACFRCSSTGDHDRTSYDPRCINCTNHNNNLHICNIPKLGPTFEAHSGTGNPDITLISNNIYYLINKWEVLSQEFLSDHRFIGVRLRDDLPSTVSDFYFKTKFGSQKFLNLFKIHYDKMNNRADSICNVDQLEEFIGVFMHHLSLAYEQALQFAAEDNAKVLWDKIRATFIGRGEDRKIDAGNELKNIAMKNNEPVGDYIARARGILTKCHSLGLDASPRELVYHTVRGLNGKFSKVRDILKTQREKSMEEVLQILREEETTFNLPITTRMDGINAEAFYSRRKNEKQTRLCYICRKQGHQSKDCYYRNKNSPSTSQRNITQRNNSSRKRRIYSFPSRRKTVTIPGSWIVVHPVIWLKNLCGSRILVQ
ncbi:retrovirus-related Pol polyprotein from transposon TNT 1-94 [Trichonephila clavipes]|nr:retrovirus-related Pol polyprotein from transposon TNT 1-94 [Trichonephila clavipes]